MNFCCLAFEKIIYFFVISNFAMNSRLSNISRNVVWGFLGKAISLLLPFISRTVMISYIGMEYVGLNSLFVSVLQVLSVAELGVGAALVFSMYKPLAEGNTKEICALLNLYKKHTG